MNVFFSRKGPNKTVCGHLQVWMILLVDTQRIWVTSVDDQVSLIIGGNNFEIHIIVVNLETTDRINAFALPFFEFSWLVYSLLLLEAFSDHIGIILLFHFNFVTNLTKRCPLHPHLLIPLSGKF